MIAAGCFELLQPTDIDEVSVEHDAVDFAALDDGQKIRVITSRIVARLAPPVPYTIQRCPTARRRRTNSPTSLNDPRVPERSSSNGRTMRRVITAAVRRGRPDRTRSAVARVVSKIRMSRCGNDRQQASHSKRTAV
jgi:hypothetical protein